MVTRFREGTAKNDGPFHDRNVSAYRRRNLCRRYTTRGGCRVCESTSSRDAGSRGPLASHGVGQVSSLFASSRSRKCSFFFRSFIRGEMNPWSFICYGGVTLPNQGGGLNWRSSDPAQLRLSVGDDGQARGAFLDVARRGCLLLPLYRRQGRGGER